MLANLLACFVLVMSLKLHNAAGRQEEDALIRHFSLFNYFHTAEKNDWPDFHQHKPLLLIKAIFPIKGAIFKHKFSM